MCIHAFRRLTHLGCGRGRKTAATERLALWLSVQLGSQWWRVRWSPGGKWSLWCTGVSFLPRCVRLLWNRGAGFCPYASHCPCACGLCSWLWLAGRMRMSPLRLEAWRWQLKERSHHVTAWRKCKATTNSLVICLDLLKVVNISYFTKAERGSKKGADCCIMKGKNGCKTWLESTAALGNLTGNLLGCSSYKGK